jgi:hypothetical protein
MDRFLGGRYNLNIIALSLLSLVEALQVLILVALIFSFIPIPVSAFVKKLFPLSLYDVRPERESFFYHIWIGFALGLQGLLVFILRKRLAEEVLWPKYLPYICTMVGVVFIQIFAIFKIFLWGNPWWARVLLYAVLAGGILARFFWPEYQRIMAWVWGRAMALGQRAYFLMDAGAIVILLALVFAPDLNNVLARMFSYDKFYHFDSFIMSPAWGHHNGLALNKDINSEYSLIIPIVFDKLMGLMGGFSYAHAVGLMIGLSAVYYFLFYALWRYWTASFGLAFFAVLLCVKLQFFHWGVVPLIWIYPSATPLRTLADVFFLFFILRFTQGLRMRWLFAAAVACGVGMAWTIDVGVYMYSALLLAAAAAVYSGGRLVGKSISVILLPWAVALGIWGIFYGPLLEQSQFWHNTFEFASLFIQGWGALPITEGLKDKQFFAFGMAFAVPLIYTGTLIYSLGMFLFRESRPHLFMVLISVYGLGLYHYFVHRSGVTSYYAVIVPFIFVLLFWMKAIIGFFKDRRQKGIKIFLCLWTLTALTTGYLFTYYPNFLNLAGYDWPSERKFYDQNFDFSQDASLIDGLTAPNEPVVLVSAFETKILMQAHRRPFFYYFPMIGSQHMQEEKSPGTYLHTYARLEHTLRQLQEKQPAYVFVQTRIYQWTHTQEGIKQLMAYIFEHYQFQAQGQYLVALKLK